MSNPTNERDEANQELPGDGSPDVPDQELPEEPDTEDGGKPVSPGKSDEDHGKNADAPGQQKKDATDAQPKG